MRYLVLFFLLLATPSYGWHLIELEEASMSLAKLGAPSRDPLAPQYTGEWENRAAFNFRFNILGPVFWDNKVHTETAHSSPRTVGWWWMFGFRLHSDLDVFWEHHSRHIMDQNNPTEYQYENRSSRNFPVEDSYGIRLNLYEGPKGGSIF